MAVNNVIRGCDNRDDDYIIRNESKPVPLVNPTRAFTIPIQTGQTEACNDFAPPKPDVFDKEAAPFKPKAVPTPKQETAKSGESPMSGMASALGGILKAKIKMKRGASPFSGLAVPTKNQDLKPNGHTSPNGTGTEKELQKKIWCVVSGGISDLAIDAMRTYVIRKKHQEKKLAQQKIA